MAHKTLRPMKWGTASGTVNLKKGVDLPEAHLVSQRILDRLYRRGWITDAAGGQYNRHLETHGQAGPVSETKAPVASAAPEYDTKAELRKLSRNKLNKFAVSCGIKDAADYANKSELIEAILATEE